MSSSKTLEGDKIDVGQLFFDYIKICVGSAH